MEPINVSSAAVTVAAMSSKPQPAFKNPNDVEFEVKYPEGYKGQRFMPEGKVTISKESAAQFEKLGIGKVVEAGKEEQPAPATNQEGGSSNEPKLTAKDIIAKIAEAATVEDVDALVPEGETRKTVLDAAAARKQTLSAAE